MTKLHRTITCAALAGTLLFASACDGLTDLNDDPNNSPEGPVNVLLPALLTNFSYEVVANDPARISTHWVQQLAYTGELSDGPDAYDVRESDVNNLWEFFSYTDVLQNARIIAATAEADSNFAYSGIAKTIQAFQLSIMTDLWGDIPLSKAFDPENETTPAYDPQSQVYQEIFRLLDAAIADFGKESSAVVAPPGDDDLLYGGDMERWERLAYTLKARFHMRLSKAPGHNETEQATLALAALENGFQSNADDADMSYSSQRGAENPWYQFAIDGKWDTRDQLAEYYVELLKGLADPRLPIQVRPVGEIGNNGPTPGWTMPEDPEYTGHTSGTDGLGATVNSSIGAFYSDADAPLTWISYAEALFIEAEATLITQGAAAAQPIYEEAIRQNMRKLGVPSADIEAYIDARPALTAENAVEEIITQKYIANFLNVEAYNDYRRTGYPEVEPVADGEAPFVPLRFPYPESEYSRNADEVAATGIPRGFEGFRYAVWWDTTLPPGAVQQE